MATVIETGDGMSVGRVFSRGFGVIADNPAAVLGVAFVLGALPSAAMSWFQQHLLATKMDSLQVIGTVGVSISAAVVGLALQALVQGSLVRATLAYARGERATFGECIRASFGVVLPLIGLAIVMAIAIAFGFMLLIIPGIMLFVIWSVASPALVADDTMYRMFGTPLMDCSRMTSTDSTSTLALAPG